MAPDKNREYRGRLVWGATQDYYRDKPEASTEWFRDWNELTEDEQGCLMNVGDAFEALYNFLSKQLADANERIEKLNAQLRKDSRPR